VKTLTQLVLVALFALSAQGNTIYVDGHLTDIQSTFNFVPIGNTGNNAAGSFQIFAEEHYAFSGDVKFDFWQVLNNSSKGAIIAGIWCQGPIWGFGEVSGSPGTLHGTQFGYPLVPLPGGDAIGFKPSNSYVAGHFDSTTGSLVQTPSTGIGSPGGLWEVLQDPGAPGLVAALDSGAFRLAIEVLEPNGQLDTFINVPDTASTAALLALALVPIIVTASKRRLASR